MKYNDNKRGNFQYLGCSMHNNLVLIDEAAPVKHPQGVGGVPADGHSGQPGEGLLVSSRGHD